MKRNLILAVAIFFLSLVLSACRAMVVRLPPAVPIATLPTTTPTMELTTYQNEESDLTFDYPTGWMVEVIPRGDRAADMYQITSWSHDPGLVSNIPAGETDINLLVQRWDPKGDLEAFVTQRKLAWQASSIMIESESELTLGNGSAARAFVVRGADGAKGYFLLSTRGEDYLVVSGNGDLEKIDLVARSIR